MTEKTLVLTQTQIRQKISRIAYQIFEDNPDEKEIVIAGIDGNGFVLATQLAEQLKKIASVTPLVMEIKIDKNNPLIADPILSIPAGDIENKVVIVVDDVLNSGKTLVYGLRPLLNVKLKKVRTAVLIDRNHKRFPISADFVGLSLATTFKEHITVVLDKEKESVYLE